MRCFRLFLTWKISDANGATFQSLHTTLDKYSIFCGRNPLDPLVRLIFINDLLSLYVATQTRLANIMWHFINLGIMAAIFPKRCAVTCYMSAKYLLSHVKLNCACKSYHGVELFSY